jgi:trehalose-6-phosphate synthase
METWTKEKLNRLVANRLRGAKLIVVSNREPYIHTNQDGAVRCITPASGLTTALDPILRASNGVWVAHGSGSADREMVDSRDHVMVPPGDPSYTLRRVWLPKQIEDEYYYGLANGAIWPLCHTTFQRPQFSTTDWNSYRRSNEVFADAVLQEANGDPAFVFIQDYHLALLPRMLKRRNPALTVAQFWHIPWPNRDTFRAFPWKEELLDGMLGNDLLGFHLRYHCANFLDTIDGTIEALVDTEHGLVSRADHVTTVRPFPISIDFDEHGQRANSPEVRSAVSAWRQRLGQTPEILGIGVDRLDYTKGIPEKLHAIERLFEEHPEYIGQLVFVQVGVPTRSSIGAYRELDLEVGRQVEAINRRWGSRSWQPVIFERRNVNPTELSALHSIADFCMVNSLHDGMNLVAKEFVASRVDGDGVLILSAFTGAARELDGALLVNPFAVDEVAEAIHRAIIMAPEARRRRMNKMRAAVAANNIYRWAGKIVLTLCGMEVGRVEERPQPTEEACSVMGAAS